MTFRSCSSQALSSSEEPSSLLRAATRVAKALETTFLGRPTRDGWSLLPGRDVRAPTVEEVQRGTRTQFQSPGESGICGLLSDHAGNSDCFPRNPRSDERTWHARPDCQDGVGTADFTEREER